MKEVKRDGWIYGIGISLSVLMFAIGFYGALYGLTEGFFLLSILLIAIMPISIKSLWALDKWYGDKYGHD